MTGEWFSQLFAPLAFLPALAKKPIRIVQGLVVKIADVNLGGKTGGKLP